MYHFAHARVRLSFKEHREEAAVFVDVLDDVCPVVFHAKLHRVVVEEHEHRQHGNRKTDHLDEGGDGVHDLGLGSLIRLCLGRKLADISIFAHLIDADGNFSARDERACVQRIANVLFDGNGFTRQKRFVQLRLTFDGKAVARYLLPCVQYENIVDYDFPYGDFLLFPFADYGRGRRR